MDLDKFEEIKKNHVSHWAEKLEPGDVCKATIRHETDGSKNRHNVEVIVVENCKSEARITAWDKLTWRIKFSINYNELTKIDVNEIL